MGYPKDFIELLNRLKKCTADGIDDSFIIGSGNPDSKILFVGREPSDDAKNTNTLVHYLENYKKGVTDDWTRVRNNDEDDKFWKKSQSCWSRYQALCDYIYPEKKRNRKEIYDFEEMVFCTEMNGSWSEKTKDAPRDTLETRKNIFFRDPYFDRFNVIVLACGNYIKNSSNEPTEREIDNIFHVTFGKEYYYSLNNKFWTHYNSEKTRLVIHTRNLSNGVSNKMLDEMGQLIRNFIDTKKRVSLYSSLP